MTTSTSLDTGVLYRGDNLDWLAELPDESVDLVYLDPPFFSNRVYEVIWGDEAEVRSFEDRWEGGIHHYVGWMKDRAEHLHRVLKQTGSFYLHCDWHASHYLKVMLDDVFGYRNLRNEIAWCYRGGGVPRTAFARKHDTIFFYAKGKKNTFNPQYVPYSESTKQVTGRRGRRVNDTPIDLNRGAHMPDWWTDINSLQTWQRERLGYPTQKPEALLERIVAASSNAGDIVLDPFCGCGTTLTVAERMKRRWLGIDISPTAIEIVRRRLLKERAYPVVENAVDSVEELKRLKPFEFQNWVINAVNGTHSPKKSGDMGIDGYWFFTKDPVQVKQSEHVGRNVVDNFETAIRRAGHTTGYIIAFSFTRNAAEEVARVRSEGLDIKLVKVSEVLLSLKRPGSSKKLGPQPGSVVDLPLPPVRKAKDMPSAEELVESARRAAS